MAHKIAMYPDLFPSGSQSDAHSADPPPSYDVAMSSGSQLQSTTELPEQIEPTAPPAVTPSGAALLHNPVRYPAHFHRPLAPAPAVLAIEPGQVNTSSNVIVDQTAPAKLGPRPTRVHCPICKETTKTKLDFQANTRTHIIALLLCLIGCCCCACVAPYCISSCKTTNHYCKKCNTYMGSYEPSSCR